jgi:RecB family endonuclease NucS
MSTETVGAQFRDEDEMRNHFARNLQLLEKGLELHDDEELGVEYRCGGLMDLHRARRGAIDILARDSSGRFVVIEVKNRSAAAAVLGQLLGYIGWVARNLVSDGKRVRGMIVARSASPLLVYAVKLVRGIDVRVFEYEDSLSVFRVL